MPTSGAADAERERLFTASAGERTVPGIWHENYWFRRHEVVYDWVGDLLRRVGDSLGHTPFVLDAGSGEGYGTAALAGVATVVALDYDTATLTHLTSCYPDLRALRANLVALPLRDGCVDVLVSLQTVEHLWDQSRFVAECVRVVRPGGLVVLSTPNRVTFPPGNPYHHRELDDAELRALLAPHAARVRMHGVHHGSRLAGWRRGDDDVVHAQIATEPARWPRDLANLVASVTAGDFTVTKQTDGCLDLLAVATTNGGHA